MDEITLADYLPEGFKEVEAYTNGKKLVVLGEPGEDHNCDSMGCGSVHSHVIYVVHLDSDFTDTKEGVEK